MAVTYAFLLHQNALFNEIQLMQKMRHEKIIHLEELYEGENTFYMVLEYL